MFGVRIAFFFVIITAGAFFVFITARAFFVARARALATFFLGIIFNFNLLLGNNNHGVTALTEGSVNVFRVSVGKGHDEHNDSDDNEEDGSNELGPECGDNE